MMPVCVKGQCKIGAKSPGGDDHGTAKNTVGNTNVIGKKLLCMPTMLVEAGANFTDIYKRLQEWNLPRGH